MVAEANDIPAEAATKQQWKVESIVNHRPDLRVPVDEMEFKVKWCPTRCTQGGVSRLTGNGTWSFDEVVVLYHDVYPEGVHTTHGFIANTARREPSGFVMVHWSNTWEPHHCLVDENGTALAAFTYYCCEQGIRNP